jgi:uncharacterized protein
MMEFMKLSLSMIVFAGGLLASQTALAASFDCRRASGKLELNRTGNLGGSNI